MLKDKIIQSIIAAVFSAITIGVLTLLTYKTPYGYPESPFAQPKNVFFGHLLTSFVGIIILMFVPLPIFITIPIAVGLGVGFMILFNVTHPPAGGNPIIVIMGSVSFDYLFSPVITGSIIILIFAIILNRLILRKKYPS